MKDSTIIKTSIREGFIYAKLYFVESGVSIYQTNVCTSLENGYKQAVIELNKKVNDEWGLSLWNKIVIAA